ncbi:hypothetical protein HY523_02135 [Candidatus Berkelbacteria bacterium]|nr:hypothetical protein [Candidatus Berkelbacteria bacterium]
MSSKFAHHITETIKERSLTPRGKLSLVAEMVGYAVLLVLTASLFIFATNWLLYGLWSAGLVDAARFVGLGPILSSIPYPLVFLVSLTLFLLLRSVRHYDISYHQPFVVLSLGLVIGGFGLGWIVFRTHLNERLSIHADRPAAALVRPIYREWTKPGHFSEYSLAGRVAEMSDDEMVLTVGDQSIRVLLTETTKASLQPSVTSGDYVLVVGQRLDNDRFRAQIIRVGFGPHKHRSAWIIPRDESLTQAGLTASDCAKRCPVWVRDERIRTTPA